MVWCVLVVWRWWWGWVGRVAACRCREAAERDRLIDPVGLCGGRNYPWLDVRAVLKPHLQKARNFLG